ncbi:hypothetical protein AOLI_G00038340 [Acnodon oligacanthus]
MKALPGDPSKFSMLQGSAGTWPSAIALVPTPERTNKPKQPQRSDNRGSPSPPVSTPPPALGSGRKNTVSGAPDRVNALTSVHCLSREERARADSHER